MASSQVSRRRVPRPVRDRPVLRRALEVVAIGRERKPTAAGASREARREVGAAKDNMPRTDRESRNGNAGHPSVDPEAGAGAPRGGALDMDMIETGTLLALVAGAILASGFVLYLGQAARGFSRPNGASWTMWAYGAAAPLCAGAQAGLPRAILAPLAVVLLGALWTAARSWSGTGSGMAAGRDGLVLLPNAGLVLWSLLALAAPATERGFEHDAGLVFVLLSALAAVTAAWPTLSGVVLDPTRERPLAWFVWSAGYGLMALAVMVQGLGWHYLVLPLLAQAIHLMIGVLALVPNESFTGERSGLIG